MSVSFASTISDALLSPINIISISIGLISLGFTVYYGLINRQLSFKIKSLDWGDLLIASKAISKWIKKEVNSPDILFSPDSRGGVISKIIAESLNNDPIIITGIVLPKGHSDTETLSDSHEIIETSKWSIFLPKILKTYNKSSIVFIDDFVMSGDSLQKIKLCFSEKFGFDDKKFKACSLVCTTVAKEVRKSPDFYWKEISDNDFLFPWGRAE